MREAATCGKCGKPLPMVEGKAVGAGHYCQKQLTGARQMIVTFLATGEFIVSEGNLFADRLTWGEMIEQVIGLTHPSLRSPRYPMLTAEERAEEEHRWRAIYPHEEVIDAEYPDVATPDPIEPPAPYVPVAPLTDDDIPF